MKAREKRMALVAFGIIGVGFAAYLAVTALQSNIAYFFSPSQVQAGEVPEGALFRIGGLVEEGSLQRQEDGLNLQFSVTDNDKAVTVNYKGILPDLFSEGQGVVARGKMGGDGIFYAEEVLAKHDESYMPPEVEDMLKTAHAEGVAEGAASGAYK